MKIAPMPLPSNPKTVVHFRVPTVDDAISIAEADPSFEEAITNQYLRDIQDYKKNIGGEIFEPTQWTIEDRKFALLWIFAQSREDREIPLSYECRHCDTRHTVLIDVADILETSTTIVGADKRPIEFLKKSKMYEATVKPINGAEAEYLEVLRIERDAFEEDTKEFRMRDIALKRVETAFSFVLDDEPDDEDKVLDYRLNFLRTMPLDTDYRSLAAKLEKALREMRHGVPVRYHNGRYLIIHRAKNCDVAIDKGDSEQITLLVPFRPRHFIPKL